MKPFVGIIGGERSGKSTVIRSLTGCPTNSHRNIVTDRSNNTSIFAIASSPQEDSLSAEDFSRILNRVVRDDLILGIVMAIQPRRTRTRLSMETIFQTVRTTRRFESFAFILDPPYGGSGGVLSDQSLTARLQTLEVEPAVLDARRFAHLSACDIRQLSGLPG